MAPHGHRPIELWLASANSGKLREFSEAASARGLSLKALPAVHDLPPCIENGLTFEDNARKKAIYYSREFAGLVFADDSGLCVDALGGAPGVFSARFAGSDATDDANNAKLISELHRLRGHAAGQRATEELSGAHYACVIALAQHGRILTLIAGNAYGTIIEPPRGSGGFGYDPYFHYPPLGRTFAELAPQAKFAVSHRGEAFRKLLDYLDQSPPLPSHGGKPT